MYIGYTCPELCRACAEAADVCEWCRTPLTPRRLSARRSKNRLKRNLVAAGALRTTLAPDAAQAHSPVRRPGAVRHRPGLSAAGLDTRTLSLLAFTHSFGCCAFCSGRTTFGRTKPRATPSVVRLHALRA